MKKLSTPAIAAAILSMTAPVWADSILASKPDSILGWFQDEGFVAKSETDNQGDPKLRIRYYGTSFSIYFYGCKGNADCKSIQFYSGYNTDDISVEHLNEWNTNYRYLRAYLTESGSSRIEYDVYLGDDGLSKQDFSEVVDAWLGGLSEFETHIDW